MEVYREATMSFIGIKLDRVTSFTRHVLSVVIRKIYTLLYVLSYPVVKILFSFFAIVLLTNMMYVLLKVLFLPVGLVHQEVFFDLLSEQGPAANLTLANMDKQWQYAPQSQVGTECDQSFFGTHTEYDISMVFTLAKSSKNWDAGPCMVYLSVLDCRGGLVASSARSLRLSFQSAPVLGLGRLLRLPLHLAGLLGEAEAVRVDLMRGFREANSPPLLPAHSLLV
jgi:hypothetical protein